MPRRLGLSLLLSCVLPLVAQAQVAIPTRIELSGYGLAFDIPAGWKRVPELRYTQLARLAQLKDERPVGLIEIETLTARDKTVADLANQFVTNKKAKAIGERKVNACTTLEMSLPPTLGMNATGLTLFAMHSQLVIVQASGQEEEAMLASMRAITDTMVISEPRSADLDATPRALFVPIFESRLRLALPEAFRPAKVETPGNQTFFAARNWASGRDEASLVMQVLPNADRAELKTVVETAAPRIASEHGMKQAVAFTKVAERPEIYLSATLPVDTTGVQRYAYVALDQAHVAQMIFGSNAGDAAGRERYMAMAENICRAMRASGK